MLISPFISVIEGWLRADLTVKGTVIHERLVAEYGFTGHYQRFKMFYFTTLDDLVRRLRATEATGRLNRQLQAFLRPTILVVDLRRTR